MSGIKKPLHPKSRKFAKETRKHLRETRLTKTKKVNKKMHSRLLDRVKFIKSIVSDSDLKVYSEDEMKKMVQDFINEREVELEKEKQAQRDGRPPSTRQRVLTAALGALKAEFVSGFEWPDLTDELTVTRIRLWNGDYGALSSFKFTRICSSSNET